MISFDFSKTYCNGKDFTMADDKQEPKSQRNEEPENSEQEGTETVEDTTTDFADTDATHEEARDMSHNEEVGDLMKKLEEITAEAQQQRDKALRTAAELENYRKRSQREKEEAKKKANVSLLEDLVPVVDNFALGLQAAEQHEGGKAFAEGFEMILSQLKNALAQNGVQEINPKGEVFDPQYHECVAHVPSTEVEEGQVLEVQRIGYRLGDRLIRPATVIVSKGAEDKDTDRDSENSDNN